MKIQPQPATSSYTSTQAKRKLWSQQGKMDSTSSLSKLIVLQNKSELVSDSSSEASSVSPPTTPSTVTRSKGEFYKHTDLHPQFHLSCKSPEKWNGSNRLFYSLSSSSCSSAASLEEIEKCCPSTATKHARAYRTPKSVGSVLFPSMRLLLAVLLCCCYITISISSSNIAVALICMIKCPIHGYTGDLEWHSDQEGLVLAAQNAGSLLMLVTGLYADRINGKWMVGASLLLCFLGNMTLPLFAANSFWYAVLGRLAIGASDALLSPAVNSLITRWFPHTERAAAVGIITGGRQIGTLFILPTAGYLCTRTDIQGGWPAIFYLSGLISGLVVIFWIPMGADKPAKQYCISNRERLFIEK
uniref:Major facilitator superfamily (MFS) profile domain-containing protein n=1 Tax=Ditylenchus dipsaci TaxID=166011 RepID=A0A915EUH4_9BILA